MVEDPVETGSIEPNINDTIKTTVRQNIFMSAYFLASPFYKWPEHWWYNCVMDEPFGLINSKRYDSVDYLRVDLSLRNSMQIVALAEEQAKSDYFEIVNDYLPKWIEEERVENSNSI